MILVHFDAVNLSVFALDKAFELGFPQDFRQFFLSQAASKTGILTYDELYTYWDSNRALLCNEDVIGSSFMLAYLYCSLRVTTNQAAEEIETLTKYTNNAFLICSFICDTAENEGKLMPESQCRHFPYALEAIADGGVAAIIHWLTLSEPADFDTMVLLLEKQYKNDDEGKEEEEPKIYFCSNNAIVTVKTSCETKMRLIFASYHAKSNAKKGARPVSFKSLRFWHSSRRLYMSEIGNRTLHQAGFRDGTVILCDSSIKAPIVASKVDVDNNRLTTASGGRKGAKSKKGKQPKTTKKKRNGRQLVEYKTQTDASSHRIEHSKQLSLVFEQADSTFKAIRQSLNNLELKRTPPKRSATVVVRADGEVPAAQSFSQEAEHGKAGKVFYDVKVGEVASLYKTSKPSHNYKLDQAASVTVDLHGYTKEGGLAKLDSQLPFWLQMAMEGSCPWVIRVRIICGGGTQRLSEMVETWIRQNDSVAKAIRS